MSQDEQIKLGDVVIDRLTRSVIQSGERIEMSANHFDVLWCLASNVGRPVSKKELIASVWPGHRVEFNTVEVYVHNLRRMIGYNLIRTRRGLGYVIYTEQP